MVVAVIGAGTIGLITLKNLLEEGIDAVGFERESEGQLTYLLKTYGRLSEADMILLLDLS